jgi:hypothetical protein
MIHSHLEMLPWFGFAVVLMLHWDALGAPVWSFVPRTAALPRGVLLAVIAALLLGLGFILEELARCLRVERALTGAPRRAVPRP